MLPLLPLAVGGGILLVLWLYSNYIAQKPRVYTKFGSDLYCRVHNHINLIQDVYFPSWWCPFGTLMTVTRQLFRSCPSLPFARELVEMPDGGVAGIDWLNPENAEDDSPIFVFLPGITGTTHECSYILHCVMEASEKNWRSVVVNPRGLGGVQLKTKRSYNAAYTGDIEFIIKMIQGRYPKSKKIGCGFSMGGMILWNYLATRTADNAHLDGAMIISSPFCPHQSSLSLEGLVPRILFNSHLAKCLVKIIEPYRDMFEDLVDWEHVTSSRTIREFDTHFTSRVFGYKDCKEYYNDATLKTKVDKIPIPTVTLNSVDDVFAPIESLPLDKIDKSDTVVALVTQHGGHTAFMEGANPNNRGLVERLVAQWGHMIFNDLH